MEKRITIGLDMGDRNHSVCVLDADGGVKARATLANTAAALQKYFGALPSCRIALEAEARALG